MVVVVGSSEGSSGGRYWLIVVVGSSEQKSTNNIYLTKTIIMADHFWQNSCHLNNSQNIAFTSKNTFQILEHLHYILHVSVKYSDYSGEKKLKLFPLKIYGHALGLTIIIL